MQIEPKFSLLFRKYVDGSATQDEKLEFLALANQEDMQATLAELVDAELLLRGTQHSLDKNEQEEILAHIYKAAPVYKTTPAKRIKLWPRIGIAAAAAVAAIAFGIWFFSTPRHLYERRDLLNYANDIAPGGNRATLTSNGKTINLSDVKTGLAVNAAQLTYNDGTTIDPSALGMTEGESRTLEVTALRGGIYSVILQDGTKAWLNAASKLKFLSNYRNKLQRIVKLEGQAYFEVAKDTKRPFIVESQGQRVEVLGTHFDISAYPGEAIKTTLLEGSVKVASLSASGGEIPGGREVVLKPNQQSTIHLSPSGRDGEAREGNITVKQVDPTDAIAWKNGDFIFKGESLESAMQQIARWYNVDVLYDNNLPQDVVFWGYVSRSRNLSVVLKQMQNTKQVKFKLEGRTIRVTK